MGWPVSAVTPRASEWRGISTSVSFLRPPPMDCANTTGAVAARSPASYLPTSLTLSRALPPSLSGMPHLRGGWGLGGQRRRINIFGWNSLICLFVLALFLPPAIHRSRWTLHEPALEHYSSLWVIDDSRARDRHPAPLPRPRRFAAPAG